MTNEDDRITIALLKLNYQNLNEKVDKVVEAQESLEKTINSFLTAITAGKWIFVTFLIALGALGHKWASNIIQLFTGS